MKGKYHVILYSILGLALLTAVFAALDRHTMARQNELMLQDVYDQRVMEAQEHLQAIALKLSKAPITGDVRACVELLTGVSRQADSVVGALSALPLSHAETSDTVKFCNQLSEYTLMLALRAAAGQLPDAAAIEQLTELESHATLLGGRVATADWTQLDQTAFYDEAADKDNGMDYPAMIYDGAFSDARHRGTPKALGKQRVDQQQAIEIARQFVGANRVQSAQAGVSTGGALESWGVTLTLTDGSVLNADVTKQGGQLLWIMPEHADFQATLTLEECTQSARQFLLSHGYGQMEPNHYQVYDGLAVINFVSVQDGVLLYPDLVKVQLRMDTGELMGLESNNYLMNHVRRASLTPALGEAQAMVKISPRLTISDMRLCVIPYRDSERLCWEAIGQYEGSEYRVYVDAQTGEEIEVLKMIDSANGRLAA